MSNTFITPSVIARLGLATLYNNFVLANLVWRDFDSDFTGSVGDTINIRKPAVFTASNFVRANGVTVQAATEDKIPLTLDTIPDVSFNVTSEELTLDVDSFSERLLTPAMMALVENVDSAIANEICAAAIGTGGAGTVTQASTPSDVFVTAREKLDRNKLPMSERYVVLGPEAVSAGLSTDLFVQAQQAGTTDALRSANLSTVFGLETYQSQTFGFGPGAKGQADGVAFHRSAVVLASRPLAAPLGVAPNMYAIANYKGLSLRVVQQYDINKKQDLISVDMLYGLKATRPQGALITNFGKGS